MALRGVESLAADPSIELIFLLNPANRKLADALNRIPRCTVMETPLRTRKMQSVRDRLCGAGIRRLSEQFQNLKADRLLCIQGDIEQSCHALEAGRRAGLISISYIALPHKMTTMGARLGYLRDAFNQSLIKLPTCYITLSESMAELLRNRDAKQPIHIVQNGIPIPETEPGKRPEKSTFTIGMLGRIEFKQKGHDFLIKVFSKEPAAFADCRLLIAGDGPDREKLKQLTRRSPRQNDIKWMPWQDHPESFFNAIDLLIMPSRYEGVPLVMLEALARGIPVIGSNRDGMRDILPAEWTFEYGSTLEMIRAFSCARLTGAERVIPLQAKVLTQNNEDCFRAAFVHAVLS